MNEGKIEVLSHEGASFFRTSHRAVFDYPLHAHTYYELTFYAPFSGCLTVNGEKILPNRPLAILMTPSDLHRIDVFAPTDAAFYKVEFDAQNCGGFPLPSNAYCLDAQEDSLLIELFSALHNAPTTRQCYRQSLLHTLLCRVCEEGTPLSQTVQPKCHALVAKALQYLNARFTEEISLQLLAKECNVSAQYLSGCFSREVGISYEGYLCRLRLQSATQLLLQTDWSVTEICYACGYRNLSHFLRSFAKRFGVSPKQYRKERQGEPEKKAT